jgi:hypothetical protein
MLTQRPAGKCSKRTLIHRPYLSGIEGEGHRTSPRCPLSDCMQSLRGGLPRGGCVGWACQLKLWGSA